MTDMYNWVDNPTESGKATCNTDVLNDCLMHLKYDKTSGGGLEVCDIGTALYVDETKGLRRYLNGSTVAINSNTQGFLDRLKQIIELYPSLSTTEENWQAEKTMSVFGQCGKFVIDETSGTIRLPRIVMPIQGLTDLSKLGKLVEQSLPNITGSFGSWGLINRDSNRPVIEDGALYSGDTYTGHPPSLSGSLTSDLKIDASRSSSIYKDNANVQQEQIQYPYFIQIATGQETEVDIINEIELNNPYSLFDSKYTDHVLNNLSWLRSNGQWNSGTVYTSAYEELLKEYNNPDRLATFDRSKFTVVGNPTITDDGIASGFSSSNKVRANCNITPQNELIVKLSIIPNILPSTTERLVSSVNNDSFFIAYYAGSGAIACRLTGSTNLVAITKSEAGWDFNKEVDIEMKVTPITTFLTVSQGEKIKVKSNPTNADFITMTDFMIGSNSGGIYNYFTSGSIDLKQFSITVDGEKVFSGANSMVKSVSDSTITDYDFVIDTANTQFKLPIKSKLASGKSVVGNGMTLGITNGSTNFGLMTWNNTGIADLSVRSSMYGTNVGHIDTAPTGSSSNFSSLGITSDATKSGIETDNTGLYLYYYVGETVQNANLIDAGRIQEQLANKADKEDIDTWVYWQEGNEGYRYNRINGYCEQWGFAIAQATTTINLLKQYKDTNYIALVTPINSGGGYQMGVSKAPNILTINSTAGAASSTKMWKTSGYLAEGEY